MQQSSTPTWLIGPEIPPTERINTVLSGSYRLDAFLGQGMTGITYNAWHLRQKQPYAVKLLHRELQPSHERVLRLRQDLRTLSGLRRYGFLPVELSFAPDGAPFLASELLTGETLRSRLSRGPLPVLATGIVTAALARALGEAHQQNIVHGDLRPENVLLPSEAGREIEAGQPVLLDAALHHLRRRPIGLDESLPLGKLVYLAPEQASGEQQTANAAGDIFALGAILYECLTGQQAFAAADLEVVLEKLAAPPQKLTLPREVGAPPGLAEALDVVIAKACARDPEERYQSMAELLAGLDQAFAKASLPLPPPDERVSIDTVKAQNRELRKRTIVVKKVVPLAPMTEMPETSGVMSATAFANLSALMNASSMPVPDASEGTSPTGSADSGKDDGKDSTRLEYVGTPTDKPAARRRITAKQRVVRRTVRARDLSRLLTEVESGRLDASQAIALAATAEDDSDGEDAAVPEPVGDSQSEAQRIIDEGRAAVIARAEAAKKNREVETKERQQRDQAAAQEMKRKILEQARQETLGRMRAEWEQSRPAPKAAPKEAASEPRSPAPAEAKPDAQQAELRIEAQRQAQRLEAERTEAERLAAEEAERARASVEAAEAARKEAARLEAELREAERREAERAEAVRREAEREMEARRQAEEAERARAAKAAEAEIRQQEAEAARQAAEAKQREAAAAKQAAESEAEVAMWEDGLDLLLDDNKPDRTIPPPPPAAAMRARSEAARRAEAEARRAQEEAATAAEAAQRALRDAAEIAQRAEAARREQEAAAAARAREAAELANAVEAAEDVRAQDQALFRQVLDAQARAKAAEAARAANVHRATRVTQALEVLRRLEDMVIEEQPESTATPETSTTSADTGRFRRPAEPPASSEPAAAASAAPVTPLASEITGRRGLPAAPASVAPPPEGSASYAAQSFNQALARPESSGTYPATAAAPVGNRAPEQVAPSAPSGPAVSAPGIPINPNASSPNFAMQSGPNASSPNLAMAAAPGQRPDMSAGYSAAQLAAAGMRPDMSASYSAAQLAAAGIRPDMSAGYSAAQLAAAGMVPGQQAMPSGLQPIIVQPMHSGMVPGQQVMPSGLQPIIVQPMHAGMLPGMAHPMAMPHPMAMGPSGAVGRPEGDVSAVLSSPSMAGVIPALLPTGVVPVIPGHMPQPQPPPQAHPHEPGGVTLTTRQLVATLSMTSVLSGVIGALIALLVLQHTHKPVDGGQGPAGTGGTEPSVPTPVAPVATRPGPTPVSTSREEPQHVPTTPTATPTPPAPPHTPTVGDTLILYRGPSALPPLRTLHVVPFGPPHQSMWTKPGGPPPRPASTPAQPAGRPPGAAPAAVKAPAPEPKPPAPKAPSAEQSGLHNPFAK